MKYVLSFVLAAVTTAGAFASPARPGKVRHIQPDGTVVEVTLRGDENLHFYETSNGKIAFLGTDGCLRYAEVNAAGAVVAGADMVKPGGGLNQDSESVKRQMSREYLRIKESKALDMRKTAPTTIKRDFPTEGEVRGLIILAEFQDQKFQIENPQQQFDRVANEENYSGDIASGSIRDYFMAQSGGKFRPKFDVVGPVTLPGNMSTYGSDEAKGVPQMFKEACTIADEQFDVDFTKYDVNADGVVDFVYIIFAGYSEAQGAPSYVVWPQKVDLELTVFKMFDNMILKSAACSSELRGYSGTETDGIGTFCHEFGHILGLPDVYDTMYSGGYGMGHYDVMDIGLYNDECRTPSGYTAMDRYTVGWLEPEILDETATGITLENIQESNKAYFIVNDQDPNQYFTLENRQQVGWDAAIPGHGMIITRVHYQNDLWKKNTVNCVMQAGYEHIALIAADGSLTEETEYNDVFPGHTGLNTSFSSASRPAVAKWADGKQVDKSITDIAETDGVVTFNFINASGITSGLTDAVADAEIVPYVSGRDIVAPEGSVITTVSGIRVDGHNLAPDMYIVRTAKGSYKLIVK